MPKAFLKTKYGEINYTDCFKYLGEGYPETPQTKNHLRKEN